MKRDPIPGRSPLRAARAFTSLAFLLALGGGLLTPAHAQQLPVAKVDVIGTVTDRSTGAPVAGAYVEAEKTSAKSFTDDNGRFVLRGLKPGSHLIRAQQLGYEEWVETHSFGPTARSITIRLAPNPVLLEGIRVVSDRIRTRRNAVTTSVRAYEADQLQASAYFDAREFLMARLFMVRCPRSQIETMCVLRRGRLVSPRMYIDENPVIGGFDFLGLYSTNELYLIEIYDSGSHIRVYTKAFAERLALGRERLMPVLLF